MAWEQILESTETVSQEYGDASPFVIRIENATSQTFELESKRVGGPWNAKESITQQITLFYSFPDTKYRVSASAAGADVFLNKVNVSQRDKILGR